MFPVSSSYSTAADAAATTTPFFLGFPIFCFGTMEKLSKEVLVVLVGVGDAVGSIEMTPLLLFEDEARL